MRGGFLNFIGKSASGLFALVVIIESLSLAFDLPGIREILGGFTGLAEGGRLVHDIQVSSARWTIGWTIGSSIGVALGFLTGRVRLAQSALEGILVLLRAIPFISLVPLSLRIFGLSESGKIFLVIWASAGICWVIVHQSARSLLPSLEWRAKTLGASRSRWILSILLPACRKDVYSALRASLSLGLIVIAVAELGGVYERSSGRWWSEGLGYRLFRTLDEARDDQMMAAILSFALLGITIDQAFGLIWSGLGALTLFLKRKRIQNLIRRAELADRSLAPKREVEPGSLCVESLNAGYGDKVVITDLSFVVPSGATLSVIGPSGCGKTTLIRAIAHLNDEEFHVDGNVSASNLLIDKAGPWVGIVLQDAPVFEFMTVWDNVTFGERFRLESTEIGSQEAWQLLKEFEIEHLATQLAGKLSGGQRQRVALASVIGNRPQVLLLDEPFGSLDAITRRKMQNFYWTHVREKVTAVFVTHDLEEAMLIGDWVQVGVRADSKLFEVNKRGTAPHEWELQDEFGLLRNSLIAALEAYT